MQTLVQHPSCFEAQVWTAKWMLKQVQHDGLGAAALVKS
jgi:hypothetical protein